MTEWQPIKSPPENKHHCVGLGYGDNWICKDSLYEKGKFRLSRGLYWIDVDYCPYCGEKADDK